MKLIGKVLGWPKSLFQLFLSYGKIQTIKELIPVLLKLFELMLLNYGVEEDLLGLQGDPTSPS